MLDIARRNLWSFLSFRRNQESLLEREVSSLKDEIVGVEARENTLQIRLEELDTVLRTAELSCYLYTRMRWAPLPGEVLPDDDTEVNDWIQRFVVFQDCCIFVFFKATALQPEVTIHMNNVTEVKEVSMDKYRCPGGDKQWFGFHVTTCNGLRLECSTPLEHQLNSWLKALERCNHTAKKKREKNIHETFCTN